MSVALHPRPAPQFYAAASTKDALVWRVCGRYLRDGCLNCPAEIGTKGYGIGKQMCRALGEEVVAIVLEEIEADAGRGGMVQR